MTHALLMVAFAILATTSALELSSAHIHLQPQDCQLHLSFDGPVSAADFNLDSTILLQEGFFAFKPVIVVSNMTIAAQLQLTIDCQHHALSIHAHAYKVSYITGLHADLGTPAGPVDATLTRAANMTNLIQPLICTRLDPFIERPTKFGVLNTLLALTTFVRQECTGFFGSLRVANITLSAAEWQSALGHLVLVEGSLSFESVSNFKTEHLVGIQSIAALGPVLEDETGPFGLRVLNSSGYQLSNHLQALARRVIAQGRIVVTGTEAGYCPPTDDADEVDRVWMLTSPSMDLNYDASACEEGCDGQVDNVTGQCVTKCADCEDRACEGGVLTSTSDLQRYAGLRCVLITSGLSIVGPTDLTEVDLMALQHVQHVSGPLIIRNMKPIVNLDFLQELRTAHLIDLSNNVNLMDARLPYLKPSVKVSSSENPRLCADVKSDEACDDEDATVDIHSQVVFPFLSTNTYNAALLSSTILTMTNSASGVDVASDNFTLSPSFGKPGQPVSMDVSITCLLSVSQATRDSLAAVLTSTLFDNTIRVETNGGVYLQSSYLVRPQRQPNVISAGNTIGLSVTPLRNGAQFTWRQWRKERDIAARYILELSPRPDDQLVTDLAHYALDSGLTTGSFAGAFARAREGLERVAPVESISIRGKGETTTIIKSCEEVKGGILVKHDRQCIQPDVEYNVIVKGFDSINWVISEPVRVRLTDVSIRVRNLALAQRGSHHLQLTWDAPLDEDVISYEVLFKHAGSNTAAELLLKQSRDEEVPDHLFARNELLQVSNKQRLLIEGRETNQVNMSGCFFNYNQNSSHCLSPFTVYVFGIRAIGSKGSGVITYTVVSTLPAAPQVQPKVAPTFNASADVSARVVTVKVQRPDDLSDVATAVNVRYESVTGLQHLSMPIANALSSHVEDYNRTFEVVVPELAPYTTHLLNVTFDTSSGESARLVVNVSTPSGTPDPIEPARVSTLPSGLRRLVWEAPTVTPGPVVWFEVYAAFDNDTQTGQLLYNGTELSVDLHPESIVYPLAVRPVTPEGAASFSVAEEPEASRSKGPSTGTMVGASVGAVLVLLIVVVIFVKRRMKRMKAAADSEWEKPKADEFEFDRNKVTLGRELGSGAFGTVYEGIAHGIGDNPGRTKVAVKMCSTAVVKDKTDFLKEAELMKRFASPWHINVLRLLGVVTQDEPMMIIVEYMENGDLRSFLRRSRPDPTNPTDGGLTMADLIYVAADVAAGMDFLAKGKFIHRDLAARNCLVSADMTTKIGDFGLSRALNYSEYYRKTGQALLPIRWMCPMALCEGKFTTDTDVYSFGIVLYELFTLGAMPYPGLTNQQVFEKVVGGHRMEQPQGCPDVIYRMMWNCWRLTKRPSFADMEKDLMEIGRRIEEGEVDVMQSSAPIEPLDEKAIANINDETGEAFDAENDKYTSMRSPPTNLTDYQKYEDMADAHIPSEPMAPSAPSPYSTLTRHSRSNRAVPTVKDVYSGMAVGQQIEALQAEADRLDEAAAMPTPDYVVNVNTNASPVKPNSRPQLNPSALALIEKQQANVRSQGAYDDAGDLYKRLQRQNSRNLPRPSSVGGASSRHSSAGGARSQRSSLGKISTSAL
eukprot:m.229631 g.229631  ORF g.229631 m.229631 type:complete len:1594 (+) comp17343_c0_seq1:69-4850(+)